MAGAGFKTFNTGDVLTASDVNTYLMQQTTMVFADASARSTALGANVAEGMISYLKDTNAVERYDGSSWGAIGAGDIEGVTAGAGLSGGGTSGTVTLSLNSQAAGRNAIINGGFDIWQRGTSLSVTPTAQIMADRFYNIISGTAYTLTASRQPTNDTTNLPFIQYCMRTARSSGQTGTAINYLMHSIETANSLPFAGRTVTVSFYARAGANFSGSMTSTLYSGTGTDQNWALVAYTGQATVGTLTPTLTTTWQRFSFTGTVASTATELAFVCGWTPSGTAGANDWYEITGVQLELGSSATPFSRAGGTIQGELAACQRYYWRLTGNASFYYRLADSAVANSTTDCSLSMSNPTIMRVTPTSIDYSGIYLENYEGSGSKAVTSASVRSNANPQISTATLTVASGLTAGTRYIGLLLTSTTAYIGFSAEL